MEKAFDLFGVTAIVAVREFSMTCGRDNVTAYEGGVLVIANSSFNSAKTAMSNVGVNLKSPHDLISLKENQAETALAYLNEAFRYRTQTFKGKTLEYIKNEMKAYEIPDASITFFVRKLKSQGWVVAGFPVSYKKNDFIGIFFAEDE